MFLSEQIQNLQKPVHIIVINRFGVFEKMRCIMVQQLSHQSRISIQAHYGRQ